MTQGSNPQSGWAVVVGINQYRNFQPLRYAQRDAQAFRDFLVDEAGFAADRVLLFTDTSPAIDQKATYPSREAIQAGLTQSSQQLSTDERLWVFFSGYGVQMETQDYLMPIEGDPTQAAATGIAIEWLFSTLHRSASGNILLLLDMSRSQAALAGQQIGTQTASLARDLEISTLLSCQPGEFSHETLGLRQGLFAAALLEELRYPNNTTLATLTRSLDERLPQLSEHHWRPRQHPLAIISDRQRYQLLLPEKAAVAGRRSLNGQGEALPLSPGFPSRSNATTIDKPSVALIPAPASIAPPSASPSEATNSEFWRKVLLWGGAIALLLFLGVLLRNWAELTKSPAPIDPPVVPSAPVSPSLPTTASSSPTPSSPASGATTGAPTLPEPTPVQPVVPPADPIVSPSPVAQAEASARPVPANASSALDEARDALEQSIATTPATQVSAFNNAIEQARRIPTSDPQYAQAQQAIDRWGQTILGVAEQRARQSNGGSRRRAARNYRSAIAAARLVPRDRPALYGRAQSLIRVWNQRIRETGY